MALLLVFSVGLRIETPPHWGISQLWPLLGATTRGVVDGEGT